MQQIFQNIHICTIVQMYLQDHLLKVELLGQRVCILFILTSISKLQSQKTVYFQVTLSLTVSGRTSFSIHLPRLYVMKTFQFAKLIGILIYLSLIMHKVGHLFIFLDVNFYFDPLIHVFHPFFKKCFILFLLGGSSSLWQRNQSFIVSSLPFDFIYDTFCTCKSLICMQS